ncbi:outer membrane beta-barrel protein, partial [bacterium]|nr:outer membrane beta-barrel protein [bacterium]
MENSSMPLGVRAGFFSKPANNNLSLGLAFEMSYISQYLKRQNTSVTVNSSDTYAFGFWVNDYLKINTFTLLSGDVLVQFYNETFRPYIGLGLGMTINTVSSSYIYQYHNGVFRKPLSETSIGFLYRIPIGVRIKINESSSLMGEYRISYNSFSFNRGIKNEIDGINMSFSQFFLGFGFSFF